MRVAKRYIAKEEVTTYSINTIHIVAETEEEAMEILRSQKGKLIRMDIQEERMDNRWIDSSEPITETEHDKFNEQRLPNG